jgi:PAS domain S-box-containing protein
MEKSLLLSADDTDFNAVINSLEDVIFLLNEKGEFLKVWTSVEKPLLIAKEDYELKDVNTIFGQELGEQFMQAIAEVVSNQQKKTIQFQMPSDSYWYRGRFNYVRETSDGHRLSVLVKDITEQKKAEDGLQLFKNIVNNDWDAVAFADFSGTVQFVNPAANILYGYEGDELIGQNVDVFNSHQTHNTQEIVDSIVNKGGWKGELVQRRKNGDVFDALLSVHLINDADGNPIGYASNSKDISVIKETHRNIENSLKEKEILLSEVHHRVKNNLAIVVSLLNLQQEKIKDDYHKNLFEDCRTRIYSMAKVHESLYRSKSFSEINFKEYLDELISNLSYTYHDVQKTIEVKHLSEEIVLDLNMAIPCGMIVSELITNAYKHAFIGRNVGEIVVNFEVCSGKRCIEVSDNGIGMDTDKIDENSLGMSIIEAFTEQLGGVMTIDGSDGTKFHIEF